MAQNRFIFSNERKYRLSRHFAFWTAWWLFLGFLYSFMPSRLNVTFPVTILIALTDSLLFLPAHIFLAYSLMYFVIPVYVVKNKYLTSVLWTILLILSTAIISALLTRYFLDAGRRVLLPDKWVLARKPQDASFPLSLLAGLRGGLTIGGLAAAIKLMKHYFVKEQKNVQLQKENLESQLQLLRAQVHPHFLFNTLNNIYSYTQNTSPAASLMVEKLSAILRFMLYECNQRLVPLTKELKMTCDYIDLESTRYGNNLDIHLDIPDAETHLCISPLLLLPFVENCFKHGISNMLDNPWLSLQVTTENEWMYMKLMNGKPQMRNEGPGRPGIGVENVKKRVALLYPGKHELTITSDEDVFVVNLKLQLERTEAITKIKPEWHEPAYT